MPRTPVRLPAALDWQPPADWTAITTLDAHTGGEPLRIVLAGWPELRGGTILARRRDARERLDALRTALMWEPRGHADMYGCIVTPPVSPEADLGVLFLHNEGYSSMCGHGILAVATALVETGAVAADGPAVALGIDTPAGLVRATAHLAAEPAEGARVERASFLNVPSFVAELDATADVPGLGGVRYDLAFGGAFYAYVDAAAVGVALDDVPALIRAGRAIKAAVASSRAIVHPEDDELGFLYGTVFVGPAEGAGAHSRNVCVFADGEVDRSPTGTGVSGRAAIHHARGELAAGERIEIESVIGTRFGVRVAETARFGPHAAVVPEVDGRAFLTGRHTFWLDPADPLVDGFLVGR